jgi:hypothetical protein
MGFPERPGFRNGVCFPFHLYDFENNCPFSTLEIPLLVMDSSLQASKYMNLRTDQAFAEVKPIIDEVINFGGCFTILWHNTFYTHYKYTGWKEVLIDIIKYCSGNSAEFPNVKYLADLWSNK